MCVLGGRGLRQAELGGLVCWEMGSGVHTSSIGQKRSGGCGPGIMLSNSSRPGGLER